MHQGLTADDVHLVHLPLFHTNAQIYSVGAALWAGATAVVMPRFSVSRFWDVALRHRCTWTSMVPFCLRALEAQEAPAQHHFKVWGSTSRSEAVEARFGVETLGWWGMTETLTQGIVGAPGLPCANGAIGRASPLTELAIFDADMNPVEPGGTGDLYVKGVPGLSLFLDYADDPDATASAFTADGWFITGDRIRIGDDGALFFADRTKDMLKVGGENVAASEIEAVIAAVPGVAEVAVVGAPHPMLDEVPVAFVIGSGDPAQLAAEIEQACHKRLADFKRPRAVRLVDSLPRSTIEKIAKADLRAQLVREQALGSLPL
jgi:crotonobetaine/carnitine-CoA ligase